MSSTFTDLVEERRAVMQALLEQDCIPAGMELFVASDQSSWELIERVIDTCDYYVVIIGARYGSLTEEGVSFTEKEYDYALSKRIPVLGFIHADPGSIPNRDAESSKEGKAKLEAFIKRVKEKQVKTFGTPGELAAQVGASVAREMKRRPGIGWVRGDSALTPETEAELSDLRARVAELELNKVHAEGVQDTSDLAQGDDRVSLAYEIIGYYPSGERQHGTGAVELTWNELFRYIGPMMLDEASESAILRRLESWIYTFLEDEDDLKDWYDPRVRVKAAELDLVKMQLRALDLIEKGTKRRPVSDRMAYWKLTEAGDRHLVGLSAVKRGMLAASGTDPEE